MKKYTFVLSKHIKIVFCDCETCNSLLSKSCIFIIIGYSTRGSYVTHTRPPLPPRPPFTRYDAIMVYDRQTFPHTLFLTKQCKTCIKIQRVSLVINLIFFPLNICYD